MQLSREKLYILKRLYNIKWISVTANYFSIKESWHILQAGDEDGSWEVDGGWARHLAGVQT